MHTLGAQKQLRHAPGFLGGALLPDRGWTFWTMTLWENPDSMRAYILSGSHKTARPRLLNWSNEASVVHWDQLEAGLPSWQEADRRMRQSGRTSKVRYPGPHHAAMTFAPPRVTAGAAIAPAASRR